MKYITLIISALLLISCAHHGRPHGQATIFLPSSPHRVGYEHYGYERYEECDDCNHRDHKHRSKWKKKHHGGKKGHEHND